VVDGEKLEQVSAIDPESNTTSDRPGLFVVDRLAW
jgi:hypothetical protein